MKTFKAQERSSCFRFTGFLFRNGLAFCQLSGEEEYQCRLAGLLADVRRLPEVPNIVATDLLVLAENLVRLYVLARRTNAEREFYFEERVCKRQQLFAGWQNVERFILQISDWPVYYCRFLIGGGSTMFLCCCSFPQHRCRRNTTDWY